MPQFDVYRNTDPETAPYIPYLLDAQADLLNVLATRVVIPLYRLSSMAKPARHLNPVFEFNDEKLVLSTAELAGVATSMLGKPLGTLADRRRDIIAALDFVFTGI